MFNLSYTLAMEVYRISNRFPKEERYALTDQVRRPSRAVCSNLVGEFAKRRYQSVFKNSLNNSLDESEETKRWLDFALECAYLSMEEHRHCTIGYNRVGAMLWTLISKWETFS